MSTFIVFLWTTLGGVVGSGLTQYVTHLRDRRGARAAVIEKVSDVEETYVLILNGPGLVPESSSFTDRSAQLSSRLASLEAACLIAGVPLSRVSSYMTSCQFGVSLRRGGSAAMSLINNIKQLSGTLNSEDEEEASQVLSGAQIAEELVNQLRKCESLREQLHAISLDDLSKSVWHPLLVQIKRRELRKVERRINDLNRHKTEVDNCIRNLEAILSQIEIAKISPASF